MQDLAETELSSAKERLRNALARLESSVDARVKKAENSGNTVAASHESIQKINILEKILKAKEHEVSEIRQNTVKYQQENEHLRSENQKLHANVGSAIEENKEIKRTNRRAGVRVDSIIAELNTIILEDKAV